jgi:ParB-like nuclease domain
LDSTQQHSRKRHYKTLSVGLDLEDHKPTVELSLKQIKVLPVLFQPRERLDGKTTDTWHVKSLKHAVKVYGDIEPPTVIRLKGTGFVVVDGHHTLEAYKEAKRTTIKCTWYSGTVREAYDQSMLRNNRDKLPVTQADRMQAAWKRVLIGGWTAEQIKVVCGASLRQVGHMRQLIRVAEENSKRGMAFRARLREYVVKGNAGPVEYGKEADAKDTPRYPGAKTLPCPYIGLALSEPDRSCGGNQALDVIRPLA